MHVHRGNQPLFTEAKLVEGFSLLIKPLLDRSAAQMESEHLETKAKTLQKQDADPSMRLTGDGEGIFRQAGLF